MTMTTTDTPPTSRTAIDRRSIWIAGLTAAVLAAIANVVVALVAVAVDVSLEVQPMGADAREELPATFFAVASVFGALIGVGLAQLLAARNHARRRFVAIALGGTVLSMVGPLTADADAGTRVVLAMTHVIAAIIIVPLLAKTLRD
jgi:hypothetical protein